METKICKRCGKEQPTTEFYKVKYKGQEPKYSYGICKTCTAIEQKRRYLLQTDPSSPLLEKIDALYAKHRAAGRSVPDEIRRSGGQIEATIDELLKEE